MCWRGRRPRAGAAPRSGPKSPTTRPNIIPRSDLLDVRRRPGVARGIGDAAGQPCDLPRCKASCSAPRTRHRRSRSCWPLRGTNLAGGASRGRSLWPSAGRLGSATSLSIVSSIIHWTQNRIVAACFARALRRRDPLKFRGCREDRASTDTRGPRASKNARGRNHRPSRITRPSLRDGFTAYTCSPRGPAFLPPSPAMLVMNISDLVSAPGDQDHTTSSSALTRSSACKLHAACDRVHRIPHPTLVTIA